MIDTLYEDLNGGKVYIAGPMTGYANFNKDAFQQAASTLRIAGFSVISPVELDAEEGVDYEGLNTDEYGEDYQSYLGRDLVRFIEAKIDAVVVLEGWEESRGAALEVHVARSLGIPIYNLDGVKVKEPTKYRPPTDENVAETAMRLVGGDRQDQYGHPADDFARTAGIINSIYGTEFKPRDIPIIQIAVKLSRVHQSPQKRDSIVDLIGYALTYEMTQEREGEPLK